MLDNLLVATAGCNVDKADWSSDVGYAWTGVDTSDMVDSARRPAVLWTS
jgi:hypothetical protein